MTQNDTNPDSFSVGRYVTWWTRRGSKGRGRITKIEGYRVFIQRAEDSIKGSDYRVREKGYIFYDIDDKSFRKNKHLEKLLGNDLRAQTVEKLSELPLRVQL